MTLLLAQLHPFRAIIEPLNYNFIFVSVSGSHLYGFDSIDSDLDLRGCHFPSLTESLKYQKSLDTFEIFLPPNPFYPNQCDIVSHNVLKYLYLMTKKPNGYILEQLLSPLLVQSSPSHQELVAIGKQMISKEIKDHYGGFYRNQKKLLLGRTNKEIKYILYQARILCTATSLAMCGEIQPNLLKANQICKLFPEDKISELINLKKTSEDGNLVDLKLKNYWLRQLTEKEVLLDQAFENSNLPHFDPKKIHTLIQQFIANHFELKII